MKTKKEGNKTKQEKKEKSHEKKVDDAGGIFVPAGILIGMGIGFAVDQFVAGLFIGLGAGFLAMAIIKLVHLKKK